MATSWNTMTNDEKFDWLRTQVEALGASIARVNQSLTTNVNRANTNLEKMVKDLAAEVEELKKRVK